MVHDFVEKRSLKAATRAVVRVVDTERLEKDEDRIREYETLRYKPFPS